MRTYTTGSVAFAVMLAAAMASAAEPIEVLRDVVYVQRDTGSLKADFYLPPGEGPFPGVLVVHGGAWVVGDKSHMAFIGRRLAEEGFVAMSIQYRLAPRSLFPAQIDDCKAAVQFLREHAKKYRVDADRIAGYGYSAGGQLVALLGTLGDLEVGDDASGRQSISTRLQAVVAGGAPCDFRQLPAASTQLAYWLGACRQEKPEIYDQASAACFITADDPPMLFFHGEADTLVPLASPKAMAAELAAAGVASSLYVVPGTGHIKAFRDTGAVAKSLEFLKSQLGSTGQAAQSISVKQQGGQ